LLDSLLQEMLNGGGREEGSIKVTKMI